MSNCPLLICLTATRNYGWVTRAFLKANSQWADYIIVVDQMSTDGTQAMCAEYEKVILIEDHDLSYSETRRSTMAINRAREIEGDKILINLDIDEVLPANWMETNDGQRILKSKPGDMFVLFWANLLPDKKHFKSEKDALYRAFHDDGVSEFDNQGKDMHTHCLPWCPTQKEVFVHDFPILHFGIYNTSFQFVKRWYYYQMVDYDLNHRSAVSLSRFYRKAIPFQATSTDQEIKTSWLWKDFDIFSQIEVITPLILWQEIRRFIEKKGITHYQKLDIWDEEFIRKTEVQDPRSFLYKALHFYLRATEKYQYSIPVRAIDKLLKWFV